MNESLKFKIKICKLHDSMMMMMMMMMMDVNQ